MLALTIFFPIVIFSLRIYRTSGAAAAAGDDCFKYFDVSNKTIIKTSESLKNGAKFLKSLPNNDDEKANDRRRRCAKLCCETEFCNMVVLQEKENGFCYLFDCGPINDLKCTFSDHENHVAMGLMIERGEIFGRKSKLNAGKYAKYRESKVENHEGDLQALKTGDLGSLRTSTLATKLRKLECTATQWLCKNGRECIAIYDRCDGVAQCSDGSDENSDCKAAIGSETNLQSPFRLRSKNVSSIKSTTLNWKQNFKAVDENGDTLPPPLERPLASAVEDISRRRTTSDPTATVNNVVNDFRLGTYGDDRSLAAVMFGLGLAVLFLLLIFLICRLRKIRRRLRRGGGNDGVRKIADLDEGEVLINGMYL